MEPCGHPSDDLLGEGNTTTTRRADCAVDHHVADHLRRCAWTGTTRAKRGFDQACEPDLKLVGRHRLGAGQNTPPDRNGVTLRDGIPPLNGDQASSTKTNPIAPARAAPVSQSQPASPLDAKAQQRPDRVRQRRIGQTKN